LAGQTGGTSFTAPSGGLSTFKITVSYCVQFSSNSGGLFLMLGVLAPSSGGTLYVGRNFNFTLTRPPSDTNLFTAYYSLESTYAAFPGSVGGSFTDTFNISPAIPAGTSCYFQLYAHCVNTNCSIDPGPASASKITFMLENITSL